MTIISKATAFPKSVRPGIPKLGKKPDGWLREPLSKHLRETLRPIDLRDDAEYRLVTVKRSRGGVVEREILPGRDIAVKTQFSLKAGDFLISKRQIVHGACGVVPPDLEGTVVSNEYSVLNSIGTIDLEFLKYLSHSTYFQETCFHSSIGVHVEKMIFKLEDWLKWPFDLPSIEEQRRIAKMLSTWDRAIAVQERLIANAKANKNALMQQLLSGKRRLPGFKMEWKQITLGSLGRCFTGLTYAPEDIVKDHGLLVLRSSNVQSGLLAFEDNVYVKPNTAVSTLTQLGDILVCVRNGSKDLIGKTARITDAGCGMAHGAFMTLFRSSEPDFAYHLFKSREYVRQVKRNLGATINSINNSDLLKFTFVVPPKEERKAVAQFLDHLDDDVTASEHLLLKLQNEKSALMQQLLAGKRRVRVEA